MLANMPPGRGARSEDYQRESLAILAGLARALDDDPGDPFGDGQSLRVDTAALLAQAAREDPAGARQLLLRERDRYVRWLRAADLDLAGTDDEADGTADVLRGGAATLALHAARYGLQTGIPTEQIIAEVVAAGYDHLEVGRAIQAIFLATCYELSGRPDLALSLLIRSPIADPPSYLRRLLDIARRCYAQGQVSGVAELVRMDPWSEPTGLARQLVLRLVTGHEPTPGKLAAQGPARRRAMEAGDWSALRELALTDVMWLAESANLWMALSAILKMNDDLPQSELARAVAESVAREEDGAR
jgi:hypothetical protein